MKKGDYQSIEKAEAYHTKRFAGGLKIVHDDEMKILAKWMKNISSKSSAQFLDVGAGTGRITRELFKYNPTRVIALDSSDYMLTVLTSAATQKQKRKLMTVSGKSYKIPLKNNSVDLVVSFHLFKHLPDPYPTILEFSRVMRPGAYCIFDFLNTNSLAHLNLGSCTPMSLSKISNQLEKSGLTVVEAISIHIFGESIYTWWSPLVRFIHFLDNYLRPLKFGSKNFVLARKL